MELLQSGADYMFKGSVCLSLEFIATFFFQSEWHLRFFLLKHAMDPG